MIEDERKLIFRNLLNGVPEWQVARDFTKSPEEVKTIFLQVLRRVKVYCFIRSKGYTEALPGVNEKVLRATPMVIASTVEEAKRYRLDCLTALNHIDLDKDAQYKDIQSEIVTMDNFDVVARNLNT